MSQQTVLRIHNLFGCPIQLSGAKCWHDANHLPASTQNSLTRMSNLTMFGKTCLNKLIAIVVGTLFPTMPTNWRDDTDFGMLYVDRGLRTINVLLIHIHTEQSTLLLVFPQSSSLNHNMSLLQEICQILAIQPGKRQILTIQPSKRQIHATEPYPMHLLKFDCNFHRILRTNEELSQ